MDLRVVLDTLPSARADSKDNAVELSARAPDCACETASSPEGGFGPVAADEFLIRYIVTPFFPRVKEFEKNGQASLKAGCLNDINSCGLSVVRRTLADDSELYRSLKALDEAGKVADPLGGAVGYLVISCEVLKAELQKGCSTRSYCVYETPLNMEKSGEEQPSHADIFSNFTKDEIDDPVALATSKIERRTRLFNLFRDTYSSDFEHLGGTELASLTSSLLEQQTRT